MITEAGDKATADAKAAIEKAIGDLEVALKGDDKAEIEAKSDALSEATTPPAQEMYAEQPRPGAAGQGSDGGAKDAGDAVAHAEIEEVKDNQEAPLTKVPAGRFAVSDSARGGLPPRWRVWSQRIRGVEDLWPNVIITKCSGLSAAPARQS